MKLHTSFTKNQRSKRQSRSSRINKSVSFDFRNCWSDTQCFACSILKKNTSLGTPHQKKYKFHWGRLQLFSTEPYLHFRIKTSIKLKFCTFSYHECHYIISPWSYFKESQSQFSIFQSQRETFQSLRRLQVLLYKKHYVKLCPILLHFVQLIHLSLEKSGFPKNNGFYVNFNPLEQNSNKITLNIWAKLFRLSSPKVMRNILQTLYINVYRQRKETYTLQVQQFLFHLLCHWVLILHQHFKPPLFRLTHS